LKPFPVHAAPQFGPSERWEQRPPIGQPDPLDIPVAILPEPAQEEHVAVNIKNMKMCKLTTI
jgi:hypothetical protein